MQAYVYIKASDRNGTLYTGVTSDLPRRVGQHRTGALPGFTDGYKVYRLVYYEVHSDIVAALTAEKRYKKWKRIWKIRLIESINPDWRDLYEDICF